MSERLQNAPMKDLDYWVDCSVRKIWNAHSEHDARVNGTRLFKTLMNEIKTNADTVEKSHLQLAKDMQLDENYHQYDHEALALQREVDAKNVHLNEYEEHLNLDLQHQRQVVSQYEDWLRALRVENNELTTQLKLAQQRRQLKKEKETIMSERLHNAPMKALDYWVDCSVRQIWNAHSEHEARVNGTRLFKTLMNEIKTNADTVEKCHLQLAKDMQLDENYHQYDHEALALQREVDAKNVHLNEYEEHLNLDLQHQRQVVSQYEDWLRALQVENNELTTQLSLAQQRRYFPRQ
ncbi:uncharacterized protein LOC115952673 isoform X2 [Quercus lobata]|uniref:uncharacterized protein LOC115952673 isoform X2 n=1 Tax=Quercus lobata TaxID=97700 RepID=UPI0012491F25|nr:uncharacterized protein LOC115952673 isoform X2 [Quercus lobata]